MHTNASVSHLSRLLQLASPGLPIGGYSYSQGMEWAIESGVIVDATTAQEWIESVMQLFYTQFELPIVKRLYAAFDASDDELVKYWDQRYKASRDTAESQLESRQMGYSLLRLQTELSSLDEYKQRLLEQINEPAFPTVFAATANHWQIPIEQALHVYLWAWLENQVNVAMKAIPLGQVAGQKILLTVSDKIAYCVALAIECNDADISNFCPALSIAGCQHESQYSRLFRS